ncbi:MAG: T9SS type A sorting domain-containing protein [Bacteroidales bacterium]|nr:T9SS type A sorting domain-containing protein [Bacteroidales bacterium]
MKNTTFVIIFIFIISNCFSQGNIRITGGTLKTSSNPVGVTINDFNFQNNSNSTHNLQNSTFIFKGSTNTFLGGNFSTTFYNIRIAKSTGVSVYLTQHQTVNNQIYMESGDLDLRNYNITLSSTATLDNEAFNRRVKATDGTNDGMGTGYLTTTRNNPSGNVANLGLNFTPSANLGSTEIRRGHQKLQGSGSYTGNYSIFRYYRIIPTTMSTLTINNFYYFGGSTNPELNAHPEANLQMFQQVNYGGPNYWQPRPTTNLDITNDYLSSTTSLPGTLNYILITLASTSTPLPVELTYFSGKCLDGKIMLNWQTASEYNNSGFVIQRSIDAHSWISIGFVEGKGFSNQTNNYSFIDNINTYAFYRLLQIDFDNNITYSDIISVVCNQDVTSEFDVIPVYPNIDNVNIIVKGIPNNVYRLEFINIIGQKIYNKEIKLTENSQLINLSRNIFASGVYYIIMSSNTDIICKSMYIE